MLTDRHGDTALFSGLDSLVPQQEVALRAIEQTRQLLLQGIQPLATPGEGAEETTGGVPASSQSCAGEEDANASWTFLRYGLAVAALLLVAGAVYFFGIRKLGERTARDEIAGGKPSPPFAKPESGPVDSSTPVTGPAFETPVERSANKPPDNSLRLKPDEGDAELLALIAEHPNLARVDVGGSRITTTGLAELTRLKNLTHLGLEGTQVSTDHLQSLSRLESVEVVRATDETVMRLKVLENLTELGLSNSSKLTDAGLVHLAGMGKLQRIWLTNNEQIGNAGLAQLKGLEAICELKLNGTGITDEGLGQLAKLRNLKHLDLSRTKIGDGGLLHLEELTGLQELQLGDTRVTDAGLAHLSSLTDLYSLGLYRLKVTDNGMQHLRPLKKLKVLGLYGTQVSDTAVEELRKGLSEAPPSTFGNR